MRLSNTRTVKQEVGPEPQSHLRSRKVGRESREGPVSVRAGPCCPRGRLSWRPRAVRFVLAAEVGAGKPRPPRSPEQLES